MLGVGEGWEAVLIGSSSYNARENQVQRSEHWELSSFFIPWDWNIPPPFHFCRAQSERDPSYAVTDDPSEIRRHYAASTGSNAAQCWEVGLEDLQPFNNPDSALREAIKYLANTEDW